MRENANAIIAVHNHPSGDVTPSQEDIITTMRLKECGLILGIDLLDHIIIGDNRFTSLVERVTLMKMIEVDRINDVSCV